MTQNNVVTFRLDETTLKLIERALQNYNNPAESVNDYCKRVIVRWVRRHGLPLYLSRSTNCATHAGEHGDNTGLADGKREIRVGDNLSLRELDMRNQMQGTDC